MLRHSLFALALAGSLTSAGCVSFHAGAMPGEPEHATFMTIDGVRMRYVDEGQGSPVVLIHGFASSIENWTVVMPALVADGHRVIAMDLHGFGWTDRGEGDYSSESQARLVLALMDRLGVDRADIVGHSYGGGVTLQIALLEPSRVQRIALYDAWAYNDQLPAFFHVARAEGVGEAMFSMWYGERSEDRMALAFYDQRFVTMELIDAVEASLRRPGTYAAALAAVRGMHYERIETHYGEVTQPALLLWGREDHVTTLDVGERLARTLPGARLVVYPGCGHFPMIEHAAQSTGELVRFLHDDEPHAARMSEHDTSGGDASESGVSGGEGPVDEGGPAATSLQVLQ